MEKQFGAPITFDLRNALKVIPGLLLLLAVAGCATDTAAPPSAVAPTPATKVSVPASASPVTTNRATLDALFPLGQATPLFDGHSLRGWKITEFAGHGDVTVNENLKGQPAIVLEPGATLTGITWTNPVPNMDFEVELDGMKLEGSDFFCGLTFPFTDSFCTFICGGWGGTLVGISSVDSQDASMNETTKYIKFNENRWYHLKVRVTKNHLESWIDADKVVDLDTTDKKISMRIGEIEESEPFGIASYQTRSALRNITLRRLVPGTK